MSIDAVAVRAGLERVLGEVADAGGDPEALTVVAVTKGFGVEAPRAALEAGLVDLGEVDTVLGRFSFDAEREPAYPAAVQIVEGGRFVLLD